MKNQVELKDFQNKHLTIIQKDNNTSKGGFIKVPINSYTELNYLTYCLTNAISLISMAGEYNGEQHNDALNTIQGLTKLIKSMDVGNELEGVDSLC